MSRTGSGGTHIYYSLPPESKSCLSGIIWGVWDTFGVSGKGGWVNHKEIRILADRALVVAPPSIHVKTGIRYVFLPGMGPSEIAVPERVPAWILEMPRLSTPRTTPPPKLAPVAVQPWTSHGKKLDRNAVIAAITDKIALASSWGLDLATTRPNANGWVSCYVPGRESRASGSRPSGSLHAADGTFQDRKDNTSVSFFDLGSMLQPGAFPTWVSCKDWCSSRYF